MSSPPTTYFVSLFSLVYLVDGKVILASVRATGQLNRSIAADDDVPWNHLLTNCLIRALRYERC